MLKESEPFIKYYHEIRPQLGDLLVVHKTDLPRGIIAGASVLNRRIYLRKPVCTVEDAVDVAHELGHIVLSRIQGFPAIEASINDETINALNSDLHDPLVDSSLAKHGFDTTPNREREIRDAREQLKSTPAPVSGAGKAFWVANYLGFILDCHVNGDTPGSSDFSTWFASRYPETVREAERVAAEVISMEFDTPKKMFEALESTRVMLGIGGVVTYFGR